MYEHECVMCGHVWWSKVEHPAQCPACHSRRWEDGSGEKAHVVRGWKCRECGCWNMPANKWCVVCCALRRGDEKVVLISVRAR